MGETSSTAILTVEDIQDKLNDEERLIYSQRLNQPPKFKQGLKSQEAKINEDFRFFIEGMSFAMNNVKQRYLIQKKSFSFPNSFCSTRTKTLLVS